MTSSLPLRVVDSDDCADHHYDDDSSNSSSENKGFLFTSFVDSALMLSCLKMTSAHQVSRQY